jgi:hypothetical protein
MMDQKKAGQGSATERDVQKHISYLANKNKTRAGVKQHSRVN